MAVSGSGDYSTLVETQRQQIETLKTELARTQAIAERHLDYYRQCREDLTKAREDFNSLLHAARYFAEMASQTDAVKHYLTIMKATAFDDDGCDD